MSAAAHLHFDRTVGFALGQWRWWARVRARARMNTAVASQHHRMRQLTVAWYHLYLAVLLGRERER